MKIGCILVLYHPSIPLLEKVMEAVLCQVDAVFLADNSEVAMDALDFGEQVVYRKMPGNIGLAAAQNVGIHYFENRDVTHLFFLDQDSVVSSGLVKQLVLDLERLEKDGVRVGGIAARPVNRESGQKYQGSVTKGKPYSETLTEVGEIMNSASLIPLNNFLEVGLFEEALFIDGVDHEWCWRARSKRDMRFFISESVRLSHYLGEGDRFLLARKVAVPSPFRSYYQFRNYFLLVRRSYVPLFWKVKNGIKYGIKFLYFPLFLKPRKAFLKNSLRGICDGILKK